MDVSCVWWFVVQLLFWGHKFCHPHCSFTRRSLSRGVRISVREVDAGVEGAPWGEAGQSSPVAALGQGMAIQDACLGSQPKSHGGFLHFSTYSSLRLIQISGCVSFELFCYINSPQRFSFLFAYLFLQLVFPATLSLSSPLSYVVSQSMSMSLSLYLSILARLYFFISCAFGGETGTPRGRQSTLILIRRRTEQSGGWEL